MSDRFKGKVAAVNGATGGIDVRRSSGFPADGTNVALIDLPGTAIEETISAME
jgi:hypothetical protein